MARNLKGLITGTALVATAVAIGVGTAFAGDTHLRFAGVEIEMRNEETRGLVINIAGVECPGKDCPAFAIDYKLR